MLARVKTVYGNKLWVDPLAPEEHEDDRVCN